MADWVKVATRSSGLDCHIFAYENFVSDRQGSVRRLLSFFGHELDPVFPELSGLRRAGIDMATHFRRGQVGSYGDEASPDLVALLNEQLNTDLAARFGWGA